MEWRGFYQVIVVLEGVVQGGDPLAVSVNQHVALLPETRRLDTEAQNVEQLVEKQTVPAW